MLGPRCSPLVAISIALTSAVFAQTPDANAIMAQVAANQDRAEQLRNQFSYTQKIRIRAIYSNGKLSREEMCTYSVLPGDKSSNKDLIEFQGRYTNKGQTVSYTKPGEEVPGRNLDVDASLLPSLRDDFMNNKKSKDGIANDLFPLTTKEQQHYDFKFEREENYKDRPVYRISFLPRKHQTHDDDDDIMWAGEALIDKADLQPVSVITRMAKPIPFWVRTALGTNLRQLGFSITYQRFDPGVYFPVTYGGEFDIRAVFFYKRTYTVSLENSSFRHGQADSTITYQTPH